MEILDGDEVRRFLSAGLGFSREDRNTNVQRIGLVSEVLARTGVLSLVPVIAPYADSREAVRKRHDASGTPYIEVHVATPVAVCGERDVKGLYARAGGGPADRLTGVDDPYDPPADPALTPPDTGADPGGDGGRRVTRAGGAGLLFTDLANPTSNGVYRRIGYEAISDRLLITAEPE